MTEALEAQIRLVAIERRTAQQAKDIVQAARTEWEQGHRIILDEVIIATERQEEVEATLRDLTLKAYAETGSKSPAKGVGIREVTKLDYDIGDAVKWALEHKMFLRLDIKPFEIMAKSVNLDFVRVYQETTATIASNLEVKE